MASFQLPYGALPHVLVLQEFYVGTLCMEAKYLKKSKRSVVEANVDRSSGALTTVMLCYFPSVASASCIELWLRSGTPFLPCAQLVFPCLESH